MSTFKKWIWGTIGILLIIASLPLPVVGLLLQLVAAAILITADIPVIGPKLMIMVDKSEKKTGWPIYKWIIKIASWLKIFGFEPKKWRE